MKDKELASKLYNEIIAYRKEREGKCLTTSHTMTYDQFKLIQDKLFDGLGGFEVVASRKLNKVHVTLKMD